VRAKGSGESSYLLILGVAQIQTVDFNQILLQKDEFLFKNSQK
jgi:hypothetical protein